MNFLKALFGGKEETDEEKQKEETERNFDVLKFDGVRALKSGQTDYAIQCFNKALELKEDDETMSHLAAAYISRHELVKAYSVLNDLSKLHPENIDVLITMAQVTHKMENYQMMTEVCQKAFLLDDKNPQIYFLFAKANHGLDDDITAVAMLTKSILLKDDFYDAYLTRAEVLKGMHQLKEAEEDVDFLLKNLPEQENVLLLKAELRALDGDVETAATNYHKVTDANPFCQKAYLDEAELLANNHQTDKALAVLDTAIENIPTFAEGYKRRGDIKRQTGDEAGAMDDLKKAFEYAPDEAKSISGEFTQQS